MGSVDHVVLGALVRDGQVLLAHRRADKRAFPGVWDLPGGVVEAGESEPAALARELREELGVDVVPDAVSPLCRLRVEVTHGSALLSAWRVNAWRGTPTNGAPDEHDDVRWFGVHELPPPVHPPVRAALLRAMTRGDG
ncbi:(deoxy)nucleoside triphosphate pyrophosphohydrolase [Nocardioides marinquilinus]|uniref:8-oxo-dGTP diphosphatase n=1 Tax=Nocardioides marinquilinus TaxID=1210400 RepID=A0ABP9PPG3_9ACTN